MTSASSPKPTAAASAAATRLMLREEDVVKLACEFLSNRQLHISQVTLERECGVINGDFSDDLLFLRQLVLDGQWEDIIEFIQPLTSLPAFNQKLFLFTVLKAKFVELLCIKGEAAEAQSTETAVETLVDVLKEIEGVSPSREHYNALCLLLTVERLSDHPEYRAWNPCKGRVACFREVLPLVQDLLGGDRKQQKETAHRNAVATNDRLLQLIIKGILYESCVDFCQQKATGCGNGSSASSTIEFSQLLSRSDFSDSDLSLLSWLQSIPNETFACPFEQRSLNVDVERIRTPALETSWTEHILVTPIKPNIFPHSAMPTTRPKGADIMTKSLNMSLAVQGRGPASGTGPTTSGLATDAVDMSKSLASFHLTGKKMMDSSVDQLFKDDGPSKTPTNNIPPPPPPEKPKPKPADLQKPVTPVSSSEIITKIQQQQQRVGVPTPPRGVSGGPPRFLPVCTLEDVQAIRCAEFHPHGRVFAVGSNSKTLRVCAYPRQPNGSLSVADGQAPQPMTVLFKRAKHHKGSIYCMAWSASGSLLATGSNDKTVKVLRFHADTNALDGDLELGVHDGTVRDCLFMGDHTLVSAGAGDCRIYVTDVASAQSASAASSASLAGHTGHVLSLCTWGSSMSVFASGSQDKTVRFWDLRTRGCVNVVHFGTGSGGVSAVTACSVDPSGRLLVTGHEDSSCMLFDVRGSRVVSTVTGHTQDVRSVRFSPNAYYLLSGGYDGTLALTDLQGDLTQTLPTVVVAQHADKVISGRWHPGDFSFVSTSADKTCTLWALPPI